MTYLVDMQYYSPPEASILSPIPLAARDEGSIIQGHPGHGAIFRISPRLPAKSLSASHCHSITEI